MATLGNTPRPGYVYDTETDTWVPIGVGAHTHAYIPNTLVDAKGDIVVASASDTPAILSKGSDGTVLVSDSTTSTGLAWQPYVAQSIAGKNAIINGGFDVWQRGTSISLSASTSYTYTADRWGTFTATGQASTISRQATGDSANLPFIQYALRYQRNSGQTGTGQLNLSQNLETINSIPFLGKTVTLSFYARAGANYSAASNALLVYLATGTGTDQNQQNAGFSNQALPINGQVATLTTTWQRFSFTATVSSTAAQLAVVFNFNPTGTAGANDYYEITGIQLELGSIATPFSRAGGSIGPELALCQRYYWRITADNAGDFIAAGMANSTTEVAAIVHFPQTLRTPPSVMEFSGIGWVVPSVADYGFTAAIFTSNTPNAARVNLTGGSGLTATRPGFLRFDANGNFISASAEL